MPEENKELETRVKAFNAELIPLLGKHKLGLSAIPQFVQMDNGGFAVFAKPQLFDDSKPKAEAKPPAESGLAPA